MPVIFFFSAAIIYAIVSYFFGEFSRGVGIILLAIFVAYMTVLITQAVKSAKKEKSEQPEIDLEKNEVEPKEADEPKSKLSIAKDILFLIVGAALIALGADLLVDNGTVIAQGLGVPESVIALTFVALGTSLPELVTAITSLSKGHGSLSLGNIIGANLFNLVLVSGLSMTIAPFTVPASSMIFGINASLVIDIPVMLLVMLLMTVPALIKGKLARWQGIALMCIYAAFCTVQFIM